MTIESWLVFCSIALLATLSPGPAILLAITHSVAWGLKSSLVTILGNISGLFLMSALSVLGLGTIILLSTALFTLIKLVGAAYLIYLGIKLWRNGFGSADSSNIETQSKAMASLGNRYFQGLFVALSNPKAIVFTTALFPQFINPEEPVLAQFAVLVITIMFLSFACLLTYACSAEKMNNRLSTSRYPHYLSKAFGGVFIMFGIALANMSQKQT